MATDERNFNPTLIPVLSVFHLSLKVEVFGVCVVNRLSGVTAGLDFEQEIIRINKQEMAKMATLTVE